MSVFSVARTAAFKVVVGFMTLPQRAAAPKNLAGGSFEFQKIFDIASRLRINTGSGKEVSAFQLLGARLTLKFMIAEVLEGAGIRAKKADMPVTLVTDREEKVCSYGAQSEFYISGFTYNGRTYNLPRRYVLETTTLLPLHADI